ncbi:PA1571 family protein [Pseudomonas donghuensis]|uniref:PA1571 family protein n=1 Tax=Pseudomonas donghuensis TaxID=1163398 RepID=UPI001678787E|nr:PA1571 family protein [Pseudomonas donghuensis]WKY26762.1 hypothetical protein QYF67_17890 [Pseudomonas donghuensis]
MSLQQGNTQKEPVPNPQTSVGGTIIDENGNETTITEEMIQHACEELEKSRVELAKKD